MLSITLVALPLFFAQAEKQPATPGQTPAPETAQSVLKNADPGARKLWEQLLDAAGVTAGVDPVKSFQLRADVLTRQGVQTNEGKVDYSYLAPHYIRFSLPSGSQTGRGPGEGRAGYWMRAGDEVVRLTTRNHREDRRQVDEMLALARNFLSLTDPGRLRLTRLETRSGPPPGLPHKLNPRARDVTWITVASPDFQLVPVKSSAPPNKQLPQRVDLGLGPDGLIVFALIRPDRGQATDDLSLDPRDAPRFLQLSAWQEIDGFRVPRWIRVHALEAEAIAPRFADQPVQDITLLSASLRADLTADSFQP